MKIRFILCWGLAKKSGLRGAFKNPNYFQNYQDYCGRIAHNTSVVSDVRTAEDLNRPQSSRIWVCDNGKSSVHLSSLELSDQLQSVIGTGCKELVIIIGGASGFQSGDLERWKPDMIWSFGKLTFPHEMAAIIAVEQIYRAYSIVNRLPYHCAH